MEKIKYTAFVDCEESHSGKKPFCVTVEFDRPPTFDQLDQALKARAKELFGVEPYEEQPNGECAIMTVWAGDESDGNCDSAPVVPTSNDWCAPEFGDADMRYRVFKGYDSDKFVDVPGGTKPDEIERLLEAL